MRENLFRAKRVNNGGWIEGYCIASNGKTFIGMDCKFTGLTDKNGKKIWKNAILMCHGNPDHLVKVVFGEFGVRNVETGTITDRVIGWYYEVVATDEISKTEPFCYSMPLTKYYIERCEMEVVDNPELLQEVHK